jgi:hypothetical protein
MSTLVHLLSKTHSENVYSSTSSEYNSLKIIESFILSYIAHHTIFPRENPITLNKNRINANIFRDFFLSILQICHDLNDIN